MIQLHGFYTRFTIDVQKYTKTLDAAMDVQMRQAARAWLRAVITKVPIWTGMAQGSLRPLGTFLKVAIPITPVAFRKGMGPDAGAAKSSFVFKKEGNKYIFRFTEGVAHYTINEFYDVPNVKLRTPGPWRSFKEGELAWDDYIQNELPKRLPKLEMFIVQKRTAFYRN